jgi:hypothetical protein
MNYKIKIKSPEHSMKVEKHLFSLGYTWAYNSILYFDRIKIINYPMYFFFGELNCYGEVKKIYWSDREKKFIVSHNKEVELIETVSYELKEVKRNVVKVGELSYYEDELADALKNIKPI